MVCKTKNGYVSLINIERGSLRFLEPAFSCSHQGKSNREINRSSVVIVCIFLVESGSVKIAELV